MNMDDGQAAVSKAMDPEDRKVLESLSQRERRLALEVMAENPARTLEQALADLNQSGV
jgi:hypothetical protein